MQAEPKAAAPLARGALALAAGGLFAAGFPPYDLPFLLPLAAAALLASLDGLLPRPAFYLGFAAGAVYFGATLFWLQNLFGWGAISLVALAAFFVGLFGGLFAWVRFRLPGLPLWWTAAVVWTGVEFYRSELFFLKFAWLGLGFGALDAPPLAAGAAWFGSYGLTFLVVALGAALYRFAQRPARRATLPAALLLGGWVGLFHLPPPDVAPERPLRVRLVQGEALWVEQFAELSAGGPVDFLVWPEYSVDRDPTQDEALFESLREVARQQGSYFLFGARETLDPDDPAAFYNTAFLLDPEGGLVGTHRKNYPVHLMRDGIPGTEAQALPTAHGRVGVAICFDMDFPDVARRLARDGAEVLLVPNFDAAHWGPVQRAQHRLLFRMRALECGRWVARADAAGGTSVVSPAGVETARVADGEPQALEATVGRETGETLYLRGGWRFGQVCFAALLLLLALALLAARRRANRV